MTPQHAAALEYASRGWSVFPIQPPTPGDRDSGKRPLTRNGKDDASTNPSIINAWWAQHPNANVGIALDKSGLVVLDVDIGVKKDGTPKKGRESLAEFDADLPRTLTARTGSGGLHCIYSAGGAPIHALELREGLDVIGHGYIVAPPSLHYTGGVYSWNDVVPIAPTPPVLRNAVAAKRTAGTQKVQLTGTPIPEGGRNNAMFKLACALRDTGIGAEALARAMDAENKQRNNPPLDRVELANIVNSALQRVQVTRDVALGAVLDAEVAEATAPAVRSDWLENIARTPMPPMQLYSTTFPTLDKLIGGISTRQLMGIIAPPSAGKSALLGHLLLALAQQRPVLHVSLELLRHELVVRYAAVRKGFPWKDGLYGRVPWDAMMEGVRGVKIRVMGAEDFDPNDPWTGIEEEMRRMAAANGGVAPILAIDYIQLMARGVTTEMRHRVGELTRRARQLSQQFDTAVIGIFTTQRFSYSGKTGEQLKATDDPTAFLGAAKESGDIEFDCATLLFLDVDKLHEGAVKPARIAVARCRVGDVGFVGIRAHLALGKFEEDPEALVTMSAEHRKAQKELDATERAKQAVLQAIRAMPGRPWRELLDAATKGTGVNRTQATEAREQLKEAGTILEHDRYEVRAGTNAKKLQGQSYTIVEGNAASPTRVLDESDDNASHQ